MKILLDTHVALWWSNDPTFLEKRARDAIADGANEVFLSAASVWEAAIKAAAGRLSTPTSIEESSAADGIAELPIRWLHAVRAASLPAHHADPFDRMLIAQALEESMVLATRDPLIRQYEVATMLA